MLCAFIADREGKVTIMIRTFNELIKRPTFEERFAYLLLGGKVGELTFGYDRWLNQNLYHSNKDWKKARRDAIIRDLGCDLACKDHAIPDNVRIVVHHMNPISKEDIIYGSDFLLNLDYLITTIDATHQAIHYGDKSYIQRIQVIERSPNDTCPWR